MFEYSKFITFYIFLLLAGITPSAIQAVPAPPVIVEAVEPGMTPRQVAVAEHLADKYSQPVELLTRIVQAAYAEGVRVGVSPLTLLAIMEKESGFRPNVVNPSGAVGLMQVMPQYHMDKLSRTDVRGQLRDPETNIRVGALILAEYLDKKNGDLRLALAKYSGNSQNYANRVLFFKSKLIEVQDTQSRRPTDSAALIET